MAIPVNLGYRQVMQGDGMQNPEAIEFNVGMLPEVTDPEKAYADIARTDYEDYIRDFRPFEEDLIEARDDTSLIDQAAETAAETTQRAREIQQRNIERYGGAGLTAVQRQEQQKAMSLGGALNAADLINRARVQQREVNQATLADLINIGQGINRNALGQLNTAAENAARRDMAYKSARASHRANLTNLGGSLASAAIIGLTFVM